MEKRHVAWSAMFLSSGLGLAGCGHSYGYCNSCYADADPSGVYEGTLTDTITSAATPVVAVIDENGNGRIMAQSGTYYALEVNASGNNVFGQYLAFPGNGTTALGSFSGELLQSGAVLDASFTASGADPLALALNFDNVYLLGSSLPELQGSWAYSSSASGSSSGFSLNLSIQPSGSFTGTDSNSCTYSGSFLLVDPQYNAYEEKFSLTCGTTSSSYFGLSYYIPAAGSGSSATPAEINFLADDGSGQFVSALVQYTGAVTAATP